jgi:hypothetical protein
VGVGQAGKGGLLWWCGFNTWFWLERGSAGMKHCVATSAGGEAAPGRRKGGDDGSCADANFTGPKNKENSGGQFSCFK